VRRGKGRERERGGKTYPFPITVFMFAIRFIQIRTIQSTNRDRQDELEESPHRVGYAPDPKT
jgi:hypothetical protein